MRQATGQYWAVSGLWAAVVGCSSPGATPRPSAQAVPVPITASVVPEDKPEAPEYWATHAGEPVRFDELVERLEGFLKPDARQASDDSAVAREQARRRSDRVVVPLTRSYLENASKLEHAQRARLLGMLVSTRDERIEPAVCFALAEFVAKPVGTTDADELLPAVRAVGELKLQSCRDLVLQTYLNVRGSSDVGSSLWFPLQRAMAAVANASWLPALSKKLAEPMGPPGPDRAFREGPTDPSADDVPDEAARAAMDAYADQLSWQMTAVRVLEPLRLSGSIDVLVDVLADPNKRELRFATLRTLLALGRPAFERGLTLLVDANERRVWAGALLVGGFGLSEGTAPLLQALRRSKNPETKARLALALPRLPANADALAAFQRVLETMPPGTSLRDEPGDPLDPHDAYDKLSTASSDFHDSTLVPWLLLQLKRAPGNSTERGIYRSRLLSAVMQLATPAQWPSVASAVDKFGGASEREFAKDCAQALNECGDELACYQKVLAAAAVAPASGRYVGLKAGHRIAQLGDAASAEQLALALGGTRDLILVGIMVRAIDHLLPRGSARVESELGKLLAEDRAPRPGLASYGPELIYRLRARAVAPTPPQ